MKPIWIQCYSMRYRVHFSWFAPLVFEAKGAMWSSDLVVIHQHFERIVRNN